MPHTLPSLVRLTRDTNAEPDPQPFLSNGPAPQTMQRGVRRQYVRDQRGGPRTRMQKRLRQWSTNPICPWVEIDDYSVDCCLALSPCCIWCSYYNAMRTLAPISPIDVTDTLLWLCIGNALGNSDNVLSNVLGTAATTNGKLKSIDDRDQLAYQLNITQYDPSTRCIYKFCCFYPAQCQEIEALRAYWVGRGAKPGQVWRFGPCYACRCCCVAEYGPRVCIVC